MPERGSGDKRARDLGTVLPEGAQKIFKEAYNSAQKEYRDPEKRRGEESLEETANKVAWSAVKQKYEKGEDGKWHRKSE